MEDLGTPTRSKIYEAAGRKIVAKKKPGHPKMTENPFKPGTPLRNMAEVNRRFAGLGRQITDASRPLRQWVGSQLKVGPSVEGYPTASPAELLAPIVKTVSRRGRQEIPGDHFRLYVMALLIDAGFANSPTEAVTRLQEAHGWNDNQLITAKDRLVGKYNAQNFQDERARIAELPDYRNLVSLLRKNRAD